MRKWPFLLAFGLVLLAGCGGGGAAGTTTTTTTGTTGVTTRSAQGISFPSNPNQVATIDTYFLPGQGRQTTTYNAVVQPLFYDVTGRSTYTENPELTYASLGLDNYNPQNVVVTAHVPAPGFNGSYNYRYFPTLELVFQSISAGAQSYPGFTETFTNQASVTAFPNRFTAVQIYLNDADWDFTQSTPAWQNSIFLAQNKNPNNNLIDGFLSDYLSFDLTHVASPPMFITEANTQVPAQRLFLSGDQFALGLGVSSAQPNFEVLTPFGEMWGSYTGVQPVVGVATYQVTQPNPSSLSLNPGTITALVGTWYDQSSRVNSNSSTVMISFPGQEDTNNQQMVIMSRSGTNITSMYFGTVNYGSGGNVTFNAYPIADLSPGSVSGQVSGTITGLAGVGGASVGTAAHYWQSVRSGTFSITSGAASGIATSAPMYVYRQ